MISSQSRSQMPSLSLHKVVIFLREWEEYVGVLKKVERQDERILLEFDDCYISFYRELDLEKYIGKRIGVLRTDLANRPLLFRIIGKKKDLDFSIIKRYSRGNLHQGYLHDMGNNKL